MLETAIMGLIDFCAFILSILFIYWLIKYGPRKVIHKFSLLTEGLLLMPAILGFKLSNKIFAWLDKYKVSLVVSFRK